MLAGVVATWIVGAVSALGPGAMIEHHNPVADERAMVVSAGAPGTGGGAGRARFTVLTDRMIRMEWSPVGRFEDRASQAFVNRRLDVPQFTSSRRGAELEVRTRAVRVVFTEDGKAFHEGNLRVEMRVGDRDVVWRPGMADTGNLGGTTRTLDMVDGRCAVEPGLLSRDGWAVVDDSSRLVFEARAGIDGRDWIAPRGRPGSQDWYFFGYGRDYLGALKDFTKVAGRVPLPPRYVFGSWWSRYWAYTEQELRTLVGEFREHDVPIDVLVIDMDWHLDGWTGYTWNPACFPDPEGFLKWTDSHGLQITLNLHPADGVGDHEAMFAPMARAMGQDPRRAHVVPFDCTDPRFMEAYFRILHWPLEVQGVDFWWMDWQQGTTTKMAGLDPLFWLNHLHWEDLEVRSGPGGDPAGARRERRPLIFSRWGGLGNHRYPIGFSGDTFSTWKSLAWQPEFTAMAGNVGYGYWSHDIGGHQPGPVEPELYARWIQFGALSPVLRTHTSKNPQGERRIWASPAREFKAMRAAFALRYRLLPYIYTAARRTYDEAVPLCRPLYYHWPELEESYRWPGQYMFGDDLLAAPVTVPSDRTGRLAPVTVWLPPGRWVHWYSGRTYEGPSTISLAVGLDEMPLFAREGAIVPQAPVMTWSGERAVDPLTLVVWPGERGETRVYEDDGEGAGYESGRCTWLGVSHEMRGRVKRIAIAPVEGSFEGMLRERAFEVRLVDQWPAEGVRVDGKDLAPAAPGAERGWWYDESKLTIVVCPGSVAARSGCVIEVTMSPAEERPLRNGLHGKLAVVEGVLGLLGGEAPAAVRDAAGLRAQVVAARGGAGLASLDGESAWRLARAIASSTASRPLRDEAVCRLLGLSCRLGVESSPVKSGPGADGKVATSVDAGAAPALGLAPGIELEVKVAPSRPWTSEGATSASGPASGGGVGGAGGVSLRSVWNAEATLQATELTAQVTARRGDEQVRVEVSASLLPSINAWWVVGPFPCPFERAMETVFPPERSIDLHAGVPDGAGAARWWRRVARAVRAGDDPSREYQVDLHEAFGEALDDAVAYAMAELEVPAMSAGPAVLALGSDDGVAVWLNGVEVHRNDVQRGYGSKQDRVPVQLKPGVNRLLLKITQAKGGWSFGAHVERPDGTAVPGMTVK